MLQAGGCTSKGLAASNVEVPFVEIQARVSLVAYTVTLSTCQCSEELVNNFYALLYGHDYADFREQVFLCISKSQ